MHRLLSWVVWETRWFEPGGSRLDLRALSETTGVERAPVLLIGVRERLAESGGAGLFDLGQGLVAKCVQLCNCCPAVADELLARHIEAIAADGRDLQGVAHVVEIIVLA